MSLRDRRLDAALRDLSSQIADHPGARRAFTKVRQRIAHLDKLLGQWDDLHADHASRALDAGQHERAALDAALIFDPDTRHRLYNLITIESDPEESAARVAANLAAGRLIVDAPGAPVELAEVEA